MYDVQRGRMSRRGGWAAIESLVKMLRMIIFEE